MKNPGEPQKAPARPVVLSAGIQASANTVWGILTDAGQFSAWLEGQVTFDAKPGSDFRAEFPRAGVVIRGGIAELDPTGRTLSLAWGIERGPRAGQHPPGTSLVTLQVQPEGRRSRVELAHAGLPNDRAALEQTGAWRFQLSRLDVMASRIDLTRGLKRTLQHWLAAWNEGKDTDARMGSLGRCCSEDITYVDDWTRVVGIRDLSTHIDNCHRYMPGHRLEHMGDPHTCRGEALVRWRTTGPHTGTSGINHITADPDGTLRRVAGFAIPPSP